jgi:hypothetical protein
MEPVINGPNLNRTVTVRRKAAKRTDPLYLAPPPPQNVAAPLPLSPPAEEIPAMKKPRVEEPLPTTTYEAARKTTSPDISEGLPSPDALPCITATVNVSTRCRSRHQTKPQSIETVSWKDRLSELADYRRIHGHCNVPRRYTPNSKLATWVAHQMKHYKLYLEGKKSEMTPLRIQILESLGFDWYRSGGR